MEDSQPEMMIPIIGSSDLNCSGRYVEQSEHNIKCEECLFVNNLWTHCNVIVLVIHGTKIMSYSFNASLSQG